MSIKSSHLGGNIPKSIGNLTGLTYLNLSTNQLSGDVPESIGNLTNLTHLLLSDNQLNGQFPESIENLGSLTDLGLYGNQFTSLPGNLSENVTYLVIAQNNLTFESIEPYMSRSFSVFWYAPQGDIPVSPDEINLNEGETLSLSVDVGGQYNQYQ